MEPRYVDRPVPLDRRAHRGAKARLEYRFRKLLCMRAQAARVPRQCQNRCQRRTEGKLSLLVEQHARFTITHRIEHSTCTKGDHRPPRRVRLQRREPEVFLARQHERSAPLEQRRNLVIVEPSEKTHAGAGHPLERLPVRSIAHDDERSAESGAGAHGKIDALVRIQTGYHEKEIFRCSVRPKAMDVHRGKHDVALARIADANPVRDRG